MVALLIVVVRKVVVFVASVNQHLFQLFTRFFPGVIKQRYFHVQIISLLLWELLSVLAHEAIMVLVQRLFYHLVPGSILVMIKSLC